MTAALMPRRRIQLQFAQRNQLRENLRGLSPSIYPQERQLRLEYFYNHFEGFYRAIWCYGIALRCTLLIAAHLRANAGTRFDANFGVAIALLGLGLSGKPES